MKKKKQKIIKMTEDERTSLQLEWYDRGKRQAQKELRQQMADVLGLYDFFEKIEETD